MAPPVVEITGWPLASTQHRESEVSQLDGSGDIRAGISSARLTHMDTIKETFLSGRRALVSQRCRPDQHEMIAGVRFPGDNLSASISCGTPFPVRCRSHEDDLDGTHRTPCKSQTSFRRRAGRIFENERVMMFECPSCRTAAAHAAGGSATFRTSIREIFQLDGTRRIVAAANGSGVTSALRRGAGQVDDWCTVRPSGPTARRYVTAPRSPLYAPEFAGNRLDRAV